PDGAARCTSSRHRFAERAERRRLAMLVDREGRTTGATARETGSIRVPARGTGVLRAPLLVAELPLVLFRHARAAQSGSMWPARQPRRRPKCDAARSRHMSPPDA